jgi:hypothetical protein
MWCNRYHLIVRRRRLLGHLATCLRTNTIRPGQPTARAAFHPPRQTDRRRASWALLGSLPSLHSGLAKTPGRASASRRHPCIPKVAWNPQLAFDQLRSGFAAGRILLILLILCVAWLTHS